MKTFYIYAQTVHKHGTDDRNFWVKVDAEDMDFAAFEAEAYAIAQSPEFYTLVEDATQVFKGTTEMEYYLARGIAFVDITDKTTWGTRPNTSYRFKLDQEPEL